ncbi:MAG: metal ABC transporter permease [Firmicutes bacterium]|nr:metal ABC transporter permease [Bacillota bacterium]
MIMIMRFGEALVTFLINGLMVIVNILPPSIAEVFQFAFMQRALLTSILVGILCGVLSCFVVLKGWSLLGDAVSHAVLPGVAGAYLLGIPFAIGAFIAGALSALGMGFIERNTRIKQDASMGIMFTTCFALGIVMISRIATTTHLMHILFGNVLGVSMSSLILTLAVSVAVLGLVYFFFREILLYIFDPIQAAAMGIKTSFLHYGLMLLITLAIVASLETVGIILVVAMLITPGATAYLLVNKLSHMVLIGTFVGFFSAVVGLYLSFVYNIVSGGAIVLVASAIFLLAALFAPQQGILRNLIFNRFQRFEK